VLVSICLVALLGTTAAFAANGIPKVSDHELAQALDLAGANAPELENALERSSADEFMLDAMRFLIVNSPLADIGSVSADYLVNNVELAIRAREFPWAANYDDETWAHYVLPMRVSQEPLEDWRQQFFDEISANIDGLETLEEAISATSVVRSRAGFKQTQRRDQGPISTLKSGYGRCEELIILHVDTLRAIGIPARQAYCPYWSHQDNNHAWMEVYLDDGRWWCDEVVGQQDRRGGWVMAACRQASVVCSMCFGLPTDRGEGVIGWNEEVGARYCQINSISSYRETGTVELLIPEAAGSAGTAEQHVLVVHVFNFGALRRVARLPIGLDGVVSVELGPGRYVVTTSAPVDRPEALIEIDAGDELVLDWAQTTAPPAELVLEYPKS
jgi:hypothetical protein